jgi:hypothetical protein
MIVLLSEPNALIDFGFRQYDFLANVPGFRRGYGFTASSKRTGRHGK